MDDLFQIGAITKPHGVHGEVKVFPMTDDNRRFKKLKKTLVENGKGYDELVCESAKFFKQFVILKFKDHDTIESMLKYCGKGIFVTREDAVKPGKDEYFIADLLGLDVVDEDNGLSGTLTDVIATGANDVYSIKLDDGRTFLLPAIKECILNVDIDAHLMKIHVLRGLIDDTEE